MEFLMESKSKFHLRRKSNYLSCLIFVISSSKTNLLLKDLRSF